MLAAATSLAVFLYLVPLVVIAVVRARRGRQTWEMALNLPLAVALDLLSVLALARFMRLETAVLVSRPLWLGGGLAVVLARRWRGRPWPAWPAALGGRAIARAGGAAAVAVALSMVVSRPCLNVDRRWHIPLVASLRGQTLPFHNVYDPRGLLAYHYAGDVLAAELQTLSGAVLHASLALSLAHDIFFGLTAASLALLFLRGVPRLKAALVIGASLALLLAGPITVLFGGQLGGFSYVDFYRVSFRPHTSLAALLVVGFLGAVWVRLRGEPRAAAVPGVTTWPVLLACTAALTLADEATVALLGLALGVAWLFNRNVVHPRRGAGVAIFVGLLAALVATVLLFGGSLAPGAPAQKLHLTSWRIPGYGAPPLPLSTLLGAELLFRDSLASLAVWVAGAITVWRRPQRTRGLFALYTALVLASWGLVLRVQVGEVPEEGHRFMTALMLATPLFGFWWLLRARRPGYGRLTRVLVPFLVVGATSLSAASALGWLIIQGPHRCDSPRAVFSSENFHAMNCRERYGASLGEVATPRYVAQPLAYGYEGCHPVFAPTSKQPGQYWEIATGSPTFAQEGLRTLHQTMLSESDVLEATCPPARLPDNLVCQFRRSPDRCRQQGKAAVTCALSAADRRAILAQPPPRPPKK